MSIINFLSDNRHKSQFVSIESFVSFIVDKLLVFLFWIGIQSNIAYNCCRLLRFHKSPGLSLPLARRGRPHVSSRSSRLLCKNCLKIKQQQQNDILLRDQQYNNNTEIDPRNVFETIANFDEKSEQENKDQVMIKDIPHEIEFSLIRKNDESHSNNSEYESAQMLVWKIDPSDSQNQTNTINAPHDTGSLSDNEKKILLQEAVQKLQLVLSNRSTSTTTTTTSIPDSDLEQIEFTYQALQTTVDILSSLLNSL